MSKIEWTDKTWNPITGCTKCSPGCANCYAEKMALRLQKMGQPKYQNGFELTFHEDVLQEPYQWKTPKKIFVCSMSDIFHRMVHEDWVDKIFDVIVNTPIHTYQILTKRPNRTRLYFGDFGKYHHFPKNVWFGTTVCTKEEADENIDDLLLYYASVRFISIEPMLEAITLNDDYLKQLNWVIVGGETGAKARPMNPDWARAIRDQCKKWNIPFFFKKMDGTKPTPDDLMIREFPKITKTCQ